ncbi:hypothetical protein CASFOL_036892 [Castilleja foliolosa]|uniref:Uncharacterized protein n=1 Tax=Castilleja foliolosa TaxID=1961234 RepID=A0ABD3BRH8_9LAMI
MQLTCRKEQTATLLDMKLASQQNIQMWARYPQQDNGGITYVCKDDDNITPNFSADTVFFNESMQAIVNISCKDMVTRHAETENPKNVPHLIRTIVDTPRLLHVTLKNDGQIVVNSVSDIPPTTETESSTTLTGTSTFSPATPLPKLAGSKRSIVETPGPEKRMKHI